MAKNQALSKDDLYLFIRVARSEFFTLFLQIDQKEMQNILTKFLPFFFSSCKIRQKRKFLKDFELNLKFSKNLQFL